MSTPTQADEQYSTRSNPHLFDDFTQVNHSASAKSRAIRRLAIASLVCITGSVGSACSDAGRGGDEPETDAAPSSQLLSETEPPPVEVPRIRVESIDATVVYEAWTANGQFTQVEPPAKIEWPRIDMRHPFTVVVESESAPMQTAARYFTDVPSNASADNVAVEFKCDGQRSGDGALCTPKSSDSRQEYVIELPSSAQAIILNIDWYVPYKLRTTLPEAPSINSVAAGWASTEGV